MKPAGFAVLAGLGLGLAVLGLSADAARSEGDAENGASVFRKCQTCHRIGPEAKNAVGPVLNGVVGRPAGTVPGFNYSDLNKAAGANGLIWNEEALFAYLAGPKEFLEKFLTEKGKANLIKGSTRMVFKLPAEKERKDVIAFLKGKK